MAFNQLKKWVGTQLWSTFMTEYNENVDELNRVIAEMQANISLRTPISFTPDPDITVIKNSSYIQNSIAYVNLLVKKNTPFPIGQTRIGVLSNVSSVSHIALSGISMTENGATGADGAILWTSGAVFVHSKVNTHNRYSVSGAFCL